MALRDKTRTSIFLPSGRHKAPPPRHRLFLFDGRRHYLPTELPGFSEAYQQLTQRFGFDDHPFFKSPHSILLLNGKFGGSRTSPPIIC